MKLSIIIPCYNEENNIPLIVNKLLGAIRERQDVEVLLVDNGSTDHTMQNLRTEISKCGKSYFRIIEIKKNQGYGFGILSGLSESSGDVLSWTHADMQTDPHDVLIAYDTYIQMLENHHKIFIKGKRRNRKFSDSFFTFGMQVITLLKLKIYLDDINAQPKLFSKDFYVKYIKNNAPFDFSLDLYVLYMAKKNSYCIHTIPVFFEKRIHGEAKGGGGSIKNKIKLIKRTFAYINELSTSTYLHKLP